MTEGGRLFTLDSISNVKLPPLSVSGAKRGAQTRLRLGLCRLATERHGGGLTFHVTLQSAHIWAMTDETDILSCYKLLHRKPLKVVS